MEGSFADNKHPYAAHGPWLHVLVEDDFLEALINDLEELTEINKVRSIIINCIIDHCFMPNKGCPTKKI